MDILGTQHLHPSAYSIAIYPNPLDDELINGYQELFAAANSYPSWSCFWEYIKKTNSQHTFPQFNPVEFLTSVCAASTLELFMRHTLVPFAKAFTNSALRPYPQHGRNPVGTSSVYRKIYKGGLYYCPTCVTIDSHDHGRAYWRRLHQCPGIDWCPIHWEALNRADREAVNQSPYEAMRVNRLSPTLLPPSTGSIVKRYIELAIYFANLPEPIPISHLRQVIHDIWYYETGPNKYRKRTTRCYPTLNATNPDWLERLPISGSKFIPEIIGRVVFKQTTSTILCLLALSASFKSARSAIVALRRQYQVSERVPADSLMILLPPI